MANLEKINKIIMLLDKVLKKNSKILEISCGKGEILTKLKDKGHEVKGTNYSVYEGVDENLIIDNGINILDGLPYQEGSFDCVILVDIIHYLNNHEKALFEAGRVLSDDGFLLILCPNIMKISSRLHFLTTGFFKIKKAFIGFDVPLEYSFAYSNYPPYIPIFLYQLKAHGFNVFCIDAFRYKVKSIILWLSFFPVICISTYFNTHIKEKNLRKTKEAKYLTKVLTSFPILCGESWIIIAKKDSNSKEFKIKSIIPSWGKKYYDKTELVR